MGALVVRNARHGATLGDRIDVADTWWLRLRGLLAHAPLAAGQGLLLRPCRSVHMYGMRYPLDVAFVDARGTVVATYPHLRPGARTRWHRAAAAALELPAGTLALARTESGDTLTLTESDS